jgi:hypothetical protein
MDLITVFGVLCFIAIIRSGHRKWKHWKAFERDLFAEQALRDLRAEQKKLGSVPKITAHRSVCMNERSTAHPVHNEIIDLN